jgi:hypothetical protein
VHGTDAAPTTEVDGFVRRLTGREELANADVRGNLKENVPVMRSVLLTNRPSGLMPNPLFRVAIIDAHRCKEVTAGCEHVLCM